MDRVSRKALIDKIDSEIWYTNQAINANKGYDRNFHKGALRGFQMAHLIVTESPSSESEGEAFWRTQYEQERDLCKGQKDHLRSENEQIRQAKLDVEHNRKLLSEEKQLLMEENERLRTAFDRIVNGNEDLTGCINIAIVALSNASETEDACRNCEGWEKHVRRANSDWECLNCGHVEASSGTSETGREGK